MNPVISLISIFLGLALLMFMAFKGFSIIWVAPICAVLVALLSGSNLLGAYIGDYMSGAAGYFVKWFPAFFLGALYGKIMDKTGSARSLADAIVKLIGPKFAMLAVVLPCLLMTYGGISLFVVVFVIYPMAYAIFRAADLPRTLIPGAIAFGAFGITMTTIPGTPQIQNLIPCTFYGTTPMAAPGLSIISAVIIGVPGYIYLEWRVRQCRKKELHFVEDPKYKEVEAKNMPKWHWLAGFIPLILVILLLNALPPILLKAANITLSPTYAIVVALVGGILCCILMNFPQIKTTASSLNEGAQGSLLAIMNTSCAVGFGSVVKSVAGFKLLTNAMLNMPGSILFSEAVAVNVLAGATGSASGGMSIALDALAPKYLEIAHEIGLSPEILHRIASLSSGGLDSLPQNGAVLTLLAVSNCTHKESYFDIFITTVAIPTVASLLLALVWGLFI